jgi:RNA polymerase sigma factor (sigma-70 family)
MQRGTVIRLDDKITGFDLLKPGRPYCVVAFEGKPASIVYVVPRTTQPQSQGVATPAAVLPGLEAGRFLWRPYAVAVADLIDVPVVGVLPEPYRTRVLEQVNFAEFRSRMTWLLTDDEFTHSKVALEHGEVTTPLYAFITRLVHVVAATRTLPPSLSITGRWDADGEQETIASWWEDRLLTVTLRQAFDRCSTPRALSRFLETSLRNWLIDRARRSGQPRLLARAAELLSGDRQTFQPFAAAPTLDVLWGLVQWENPVSFTGATAELLGHVYRLGVFELLRTGDQRERAEPVISNPDLRRLILGLLQATTQLLTLRQIDAVIRARFPEAFAAVEPVDALPDAASSEPEPADQAAAIEIARQLIARLSRRQVSMLVGRYLRSATLEQLAEEHDCSRGTADNELRRAHAVMRQGLSSDDDRPLVLKNLLELASQD